MIINQLAIQKFWFGERCCSEVLDTYNITDERVKEKVKKILIRSKQEFLRGYSHFTRETIDKEIQKVIDSCMKK